MLFAFFRIKDWTIRLDNVFLSVEDIAQSDLVCPSPPQSSLSLLCHALIFSAKSHNSSLDLTHKIGLVLRVFLCTIMLQNLHVLCTSTLPAATTHLDGYRGTMSSLCGCSAGGQGEGMRGG